MAYVGISDMLRRRIKSNLNSMQQQESNRLKATLYPFEPGPVTGPEWAELVQEVAWGPHRELENTMPAEWLARSTKIDIKIVDGAEQLESVRYDGMELVLPPPFRSDYSYYVADIVIDVNQLESEFGEQLKRYHATLRANNERYEKAWNHLHILLSRCKSLNEAVELYPDLKFFLDSVTLEKLEQRRGKAAKGPDPRLEGVDTALITSAAVLGNLNQGNG